MRVLTWAVIALSSAVALTPTPVWSQGSPGQTSDFRYAPPEWQTAICLPDDPCKTLVDKSGELLYHYGQGGREFGTRIGVEVSPQAGWEKQDLYSPVVPIVKTFRTAKDLHIEEEAFAVTDLHPPTFRAPRLQRLDGGTVNRDWAKPPAGLDPGLRNIALHMGGNIRYEVTVPAMASRQVALALCEGWWNEPGKRVQVLRVEGAESRTVDTVADVGQNRAEAFWFKAKDANGDGKISIVVEAAAKAGDRNTILNGLWVFGSEVKADTQELLAGRLNTSAEARLDTSEHAGPARNDLILVHVTNTGTQALELRPRLVIDTTLPFEFKAGDRRVVIDDHETVTASLKLTGDVPGGETGPRRLIQMEPLAVPPRKTVSFFVLYSGGRAVLVDPVSLKQALACRERAVKYWRNASVPFGRVQVPDPRIQALVDSSIRNIWQAREVKDGVPVFQVGPTCYRGLWIVDGAFILESAAMVGAGKEARNGIACTLSQQKPCGAFEVLSPHYFKENGIVLWTCVRHAMLTQDKAWLEAVWPRLEQAAEFIRTLRQRSQEDETPLDDGLNPPGEIDGGLSGAGTGFKRAEFSNAHWNLLGLKAFIQGATWLGKETEAARWQLEYNDFYGTFRRAAQRDTLKDRGGNTYVPIFMANAGEELPQRAQWTFCHAVYPGQIFPQDDPLVAGTLAMLQATEREGMVYGTGWDAEGIWNYFGSFYGHAWLWQGNGAKAAQVLYAFADHASPTYVWREEQSLKGEKFRKVGDMPHNWASAEFVRLTVHLLALDRGDELHLLEGLPRAWVGPGMVTRLNGIATPFGPLHLTVQAARNGETVTAEFKPLEPNCKSVVVHQLDGSVVRLDPQRAGKVRWRLRRRPRRRWVA